jgi:uncharacterized protein
MRIRVDEIPESGRALRLHWDEERLRQFVPPDDPFNPRLIRPVNVTLNVSKTVDHVRVTGKIEGSLEVDCHRCLRTFSFLLNEDVDIYLIEEDRDPEEDEKELDTEELVYDFFDGEVIEIDRLIAEQIFLALPVKVLCSEDCRGICPNCGANLNEEPCQCKADNRGSPFAKLASFKSRLRDS